MKVSVLMVNDEEYIFATSVILEEEVVLCDLKDISHAMAFMMGLLYVLNIDYLKELLLKVFRRS